MRYLVASLIRFATALLCLSQMGCSNPLNPQAKVGTYYLWAQVDVVEGMCPTPTGWAYGTYRPHHICVSLLGDTYSLLPHEARHMIYDTVGIYTKWIGHPGWSMLDAIEHEKNRGKVWQLK